VSVLLKGRGVVGDDRRRLDHRVLRAVGSRIEVEVSRQRFKRGRRSQRISMNRERRRERVLKERQRSVDGMRVLRGGRVRDDCARVARAKIGRVLISDFGKLEADKTTTQILIVFAFKKCLASNQLCEQINPSSRSLLTKIPWSTTLNHLLLILSTPISTFRINVRATASMNGFEVRRP
jgi:hypothetical protein